MNINVTGTNLTISGLWQYDYGQTLEFSGMEIPDNTECQFYQGDYKTKVYVADNTAAIPDILLSDSSGMIAYLYVRNDNDGETIIKMTILVSSRPKPTDYVDPVPPVDYSRLLPIGGEDGDVLVFGAAGPYWESNLDKLTQWENIYGKPDTFPAAAHQHPASAISFEDGDSFQDKYDSGELRGRQGESGIGTTGPPGTSGLSAYEIAIQNGFVGTITEWLESLAGKDGADSTNALAIATAQTDIAALQAEATAIRVTLDAAEARINELEATIETLLAFHNSLVTAHPNMTVDGGAVSVQSNRITLDENIIIDGNV